MSDFLLDLRPAAQRNLVRVQAALRFVPGLQSLLFDRELLGLVLTFTGDPSLWSPLETPDGSLYAVAGMLAAEESEWHQAETLPGSGGLAAKIIRTRYQAGGVPALEDLSGNCVIIVYDAPKRLLTMVNDCSGVFPTFECQTTSGWIFGSHPDVVAQAAGEDQCWDQTSLAEFVLASTVTPPFTYYQKVRAVAHATTLSFELRPACTPEIRRHVYFNFTYCGDRAFTEDQLAEELASALRQSVRLRTLPRFGQVALALSGGLDSRLLLACVPDTARLLAFTCYDQPNRELATAAAVAASVGVRFLPLRRTPDYYAENAELGVRVSGGMGTFANNHFLGVLDRLHAEGARVLLTGCYCDYLFKGLPLNRASHWLTGRESLAPFSHQFYFSQWLPGTPLAAQVRERWQARFPAELQAQDTPARIFDLEVRRTFPLCYEGDNQQRLVPQRLTGWFLPVADRAVLAVYRRIPSRMKLNRSLFLKTARLILRDSPIARVPDANTGVSVFASPVRECLSENWLRLGRKARGLRRTLASDGSWPDWHYYVAHSPKIRELWQRPAPEPFAFFREVMGWPVIPSQVSEFPTRHLWLFVAMLTQKIWFEQRAAGCAKAVTK